MRTGTRLMFAALLLLPVRACWWYPNISSISPTSGPPRTLLNIDGVTLFATVLWDAGTPQETAIGGAFLGGWMASVPAGAAPGPHTIQLMFGAQRGTPATFTVTAAVPFGAPRLDRVSLSGTEFRPGNKVNSWLNVQGANFDVGAEVLIDGVVQPSAAIQALRNDLYGVDPTTLGNPIYHYLSLLAAPGERNSGAAITVQVRNTDGQLSAIRNYTLPTDAATMDSDGDDIPDSWEMAGYDADGDGTIDVNLAALGANPFRPDMLVEVDVMLGLTHPPTAATFQAVQDGFAAGPILNGGGANGINVIFDVSGTVPFHQILALRSADDPATDRVNLYTLKTANFDNAKRGRLYYYCVWGHAFAAAGSGNSDPSQDQTTFAVTGPGDDCVIAFDDFGIDWAAGGVRSGAETLMHELGHDLEQTHAGPLSNPDGPYTPAYNSLMTYTWQMRTGVTDMFRRDHAICAPFYYGITGALEANGARPAGAYAPISFSEGMGRRLSEAALDETKGICNNTGVDFNGSGAINGTVSKNLNGDQPGSTTDILDDYPNWPNLVFGGPRLNGALGN